MASLGHTGGKYKPVSETAECPWVTRQLARTDIPEDMREVFDQAVARIDSDILHVAGKHGVPAEEDLQDMEMLEAALAKSAIDVHVSKLFRYITDNTRTQI
jgi:hypothetical protein